jgi:phage host-nuclease inhibitor protein Gam
MAQSYHPDPPPQQILARWNPLKNKALRFPVKIMQKKLAGRGGFCIFLTSADALQHQPTKPMKKQLAAFRHANRITVAKLDGLKTIMRVMTPRKAEWYLVLPSVGDEDAVCIFLKKVTLKKFHRHEATANAESVLLKACADRIIA